MNKIEKSIIGISLFLLIGVLVYPPVSMEGYSPSFLQISQFYSEYGQRSIALVSGDYGESDIRKINWKDSRRRFFFQENNFNEDIQIEIVPNNFSENNPAEEVEGTIEWDSEINIGRLLIELLLISLLSVASILYLRQNKYQKEDHSSIE
tara:strand:- start:1264 stop:1713 length:450 start_codon:yes stop_codon:yes gene_type:complete